MSEKSSFFAELKRRNVYKVAAAYAVVAWLLIQIATQLFPFFEIPNWAVRLVVLLLILGFPVALTLSWIFEITPEGIKRESDVEPGKSVAQSHRPEDCWPNDCCSIACSWIVRLPTFALQIRSQRESLR